MPGHVAPQGQRIDSQAKALIAARAALEKQAEGVVVMDLRRLSTVTDFFVICTAGSTPQLNALKDYIETTLARHGGAVWHTEGAPARQSGGRFAAEPQWVLMDCGDIVVHLQDEHARSFYQLEQLWADAPRVPVEASPASVPSETTRGEGRVPRGISPR